MSDLIPRLADDPQWNGSSNHRSSVVAALRQAYRSLSRELPRLSDFLEALAILDPVAEEPMPDLVRIQVTLVLAMVAGAEGDAMLVQHYAQQALDIATRLRAS